MECPRNPLREVPVPRKETNMVLTRLAIPLATVAALGLPPVLRAQMAHAEPLPMPRGVPDAGDPTAVPASPACGPVQRIKVIVPPPEIVYRDACHKPGLLGRCKSAAEPCVVAPPCAPPGGGNVSFNMSMAIPFSMNAAFSQGFGGANLLGALNGQGFGGANLLGALNGLSAAPNPNLAAALGLAGKGGGLSGVSSQEAQLLRMLLNRSAPGGGEGLSGSAPPSADEVEARIRKLNNDITVAMNAEADRVRTQLKQDLNDAMTRLLKATKDVEDLRGRVKALEDKKPNP
jgi:hypothetical protein